MPKEKKKTVKHYPSNKSTSINLPNIYKSNSVNLLKEKKEAFKNLLDNDFTDNSLSDINNLNLISSLKETSFSKGKGKTVKDLLINKPSETLLIKRKLLIVKVPSIKRNPW